MKKPAFITRVRSARKLGQEAMERAEAKANEHVADFSARALAHIQTVARSLGPDGRVRGEDLVNGAKVAGIRPHDDRAFGAVFQKAVREGLIVPVGFAPGSKAMARPVGACMRAGRGL